MQLSAIQRAGEGVLNPYVARVSEGAEIHRNFTFFKVVYTEKRLLTGVRKFVRKNVGKLQHGVHEKP